MRDTIGQFMWGFQQSFRRGLERATDDVFADLGQPCASTGYLIGIRHADGDRHPLCIEPEDGPLLPQDFEGIRARAEQLYAEDPESRVHHSHPLVHERRHRWALERSYGTAIREVIEDHSGGALTCFVGYPTSVEQHSVYPVVAVPTDVVESVPKLRRDSGEDPRWKVDQSIAHAALAAVLAQATQALHLPNAGEAAEIGVDVNAVGRAAVERLARAVTVLSGNETSGSLAEAMNRLCTMRYEQRVGVGRLILASPDATDIDIDLTFRQPIRVREIRTLRKLLELSSSGGPGLLTDGDDVYGLGRVKSSYEPTTERIFELLVLGDGTWELRHGATALVTVQFGAPQIPQQPLSEGRFAEIVSRVFDVVGGCDVGALWDLAVGASKAEHGTMIVVSSEASDEAARLHAQALPVEPVGLPYDVLHNVIQIDGAVLVDPQGDCHALGVILDGIAGDVGDRSRGARYNSAIKYLASTTTPTVIVLVSEDGMINLLPDLHPRVSRVTIELAVDQVREAAAIEPVHAERFYKAFDRLKELRFYLSQDQCDEVNQLHGEHWERRRAEGATIWINPELLAPDPRMDDSYFQD